MILHKLIINNDNIRFTTNVMRNELRYLKPFEAKIINKLRTEHVNLNHYKYHRYKDPTANFGNCIHCNRAETVEHYLIDCNGVTDKLQLDLNPNAINYNAMRNIFKFRLKSLSIFFKNPMNFTTRNILFPHCLQRKPSRDGLSSKEYKQKLDSQLDRRINILKELTNFVKATKRFDREKYGM